jgi:hypothetical protein
MVTAGVNGIHHGQCAAYAQRKAKEESNHHVQNIHSVTLSPATSSHAKRIGVFRTDLLTRQVLSCLRMKLWRSEIGLFAEVQDADYAARRSDFAQECYFREAASNLILRFCFESIKVASNPVFRVKSGPLEIKDAGSNCTLPRSWNAN